MDNSFFGNAEWQNAVYFLDDYPVDIQGVDVRVITDEQCQVLAGMNHHKQIKIAWDDPKDFTSVLEGIHRLIKYVKPYKIMCYVLIGFNSTEDEDLVRIRNLKSLKIDPFVMPYNKTDPYQKKLARWCNRQAICQSVKWEDYK